VPPLRTVRETVPAYVEDAIVKALAKVPADRFATGAQFAGALTPSTMTATQDHPLRVGGLYGLASVGVLAVAYFLTIRLGLPSWVTSGTAVLLLVGLPIMVATGLSERRRAIARATGTSPLATGPLAGLLTWRRAIGGGGLAFGTLGVAAAGYMAMRLLGIGPLGTLVASGVIRNREPLILADFANRSADSTLGPSLTTAFRVDLSQSPTVKLVDAPAVSEALQRMRRVPGTPLDLALARELAVRLGIKAVVSGQLDPVGRGYVLSASLVSAASGQVLTSVREATANDAGLIPAIDHLSKGLRERIGESLRTIRTNPPLERVTTGSLEALRKYSEAVHVFDELFDYERAISLLEEATALDTGFGMAWGTLAGVLSDDEAARGRIIAAATKAFEHRDRMPALERYLTSATYYDLVDYDLAKQTAAHRSALELDPDNLRATEKLAWDLVRARNWVEAESLDLRGMRLGNGWQATGGAIWAQVAQGHLADAQATLDRYAQTAPRSPFVRSNRARLAIVRGDYAIAEQEFEQLRREQQASLSWTSETSWFLALLDELRGKLARAEQHQRDYMEESKQRGVPRDYIVGAIALAWLDLRRRNRVSDGLKEVDAALRRYPLSTIPAVDRPYALVAAFFARAGRVEQAKRLLAEFEAVVPEGIRRGDFLRHVAAGEVALAEGRTHDAIAAYRRWYDEDACTTCGLFEIASLYDRAGQADSALVTYEEIVSTPGLFGLVDNFYTLAPSYKRLGELYEGRGDRDKAREYYSRFVELWKDADLELQPAVADARTALKRLGSRPR
jgi:tetratricopeptide (TPR) repeat protein